MGKLDVRCPAHTHQQAKLLESRKFVGAVRAQSRNVERLHPEGLGWHYPVVGQQVSCRQQRWCSRSSEAAEDGDYDERQHDRE